MSQGSSFIHVPFVSVLAAYKFTRFQISQFFIRYTIFNVCENSETRIFFFFLINFILFLFLFIFFPPQGTSVYFLFFIFFIYFFILPILFYFILFLFFQFYFIFKLYIIQFRSKCLYLYVFIKN